MKSTWLVFIILFTNMSLFSQIKVNEKLIPFHNKQGKWGYLDADTDKIVIPAKYDHASLFENGIATVHNKNPYSKTQYDQSLSGYIRENGEEVLSINFTGIYEVKNQLDSIFHDLKTITFENGTNGILKLPEGKWLVEPGKYEEVVFYNRNSYLADSKDFYIDSKMYSAPKDCKIETIDFENHFFIITKSEKEPNKGLCTWEGKIILEPKYIEVKYAQKTKTFVASTLDAFLTIKNFGTKVLKNYLLDKNGSQLANFSSKYFPSFQKEDSIGNFEYIEKEFSFDLKTGKLINKPISEEDKNGVVFQDLKTKLYGLKDVNGNEIIKPIYEELSIINDDLLRATKNIDGKSIDGVLDKYGKQIIPFLYETLSYSNKSYIAQKDKKWGALSYEGEEEIPFIYNYSFYFKNGFANVFKDSGEGVINQNGDLIISTEYKTIFKHEIEDKVLLSDLNFNYEKSTYFTAEKDKKWGMFDSKGKRIISFEYGYIRVSNDIKQLEKGWVITEDLQRDKSGLINIYTNVTIPPIYSGIHIFDTYLIANKRTENDYTYQLLDLNGKPISNEIYDKMDLKFDYFIVSKNKQEGIMNQKGEIVVPLKFNYIWAETPNLIRIWNNENHFYINVKTGKEYKLKIN